MILNIDQQKWEDFLIEHGAKATERSENKIVKELYSKSQREQYKKGMPEAEKTKHANINPFWFDTSIIARRR